MNNHRELTFEAVDELGFAFEDGVLTAESIIPYRYLAVQLGPLLELAMLMDAGSIPNDVERTNIESGAFAGLIKHVKAANPCWTCLSGRLGVMRLGDTYGDEEDTRWAGFSIKAMKAAKNASFSPSAAGQLVGAVKEMHSNIYEHSELSRSGVVAFAAQGGVFEVVVCDQGVGVLQSLRSNPKYADLSSEAEALKFALQPGVSRLSNQGSRGLGFDRMFNGLLNMNTALRFRSGSGIVTIESLQDRNPVPIVSERALITGFLIAIACDSRRLRLNF
jgi:anti-sigma regulatory factor (Ser/Thr protein kinase)